MTGIVPLSARGYTIHGKGGFLVERVSGFSANVIGLPLSKLTRALLEMEPSRRATRIKTHLLAEF